MNDGLRRDGEWLVKLCCFVGCDLRVASCEVRNICRNLLFVACLRFLRNFTTTT